MVAVRKGVANCTKAGRLRSIGGGREEEGRVQQRKQHININISGVLSPESSLRLRFELSRLYF